MASFSKRGDQTLAQVRVKRGGVVVFSQSQVFAVVDFATRRRNIDKVSPATILSNLSPLSAAIHAAPYAHEIRVDPTEIDIAMKRLADMGLVAKSRQVERLVDHEEEDALLEQFHLRNLMPQTEIDTVRMYKIALALPRRVASR
ncbi:MAG: hypothetical protein JF606_28630 [Burkholderiales bacterium]|jgi:phage tail sheath gpL-like|nr:hypothetical protein [Burkholderiales bacterium]